MLIGTSLIVLPTTIAEMLNTQIGAKKSWNGQYQLDCAKVPGLPDFTFHFDGKPYALAGTDYILNLQGTCVSAFTGMDINIPGGDLWIVGESFASLVNQGCVLMVLAQVMCSCGSTTPCMTSGATRSALQSPSKHFATSSPSAAVWGLEFRERLWTPLLYYQSSTSDNNVVNPCVSNYMLWVRVRQCGLS